MVRRPGPRRRTAAALLVLAAAGTVAVVPAPPASAAACPARSTSALLAGLGDQNQYFLAPGGGFEYSDRTWARSGLAYSSMLREPWQVVPGTASVALPWGAAVTSPQLCIGPQEDSIRFFLRVPSLPGSVLHVHVDVVSGVNRATNDVDILSGPRAGSRQGWWLADRVALPDIRDASGTQLVTITLSSRGLPMTWSVDDLLVDPWKNR